MRVSLRSAGLPAFRFQAVCLSVFLCSVGAVGSDAMAGEVVFAPSPQAVNDGLGLIHGQVFTPILPADANEGFSVEVQINGVPATVQLAPFSIRSPEYAVEIDLGGGEMRTVEPGPVRTLRGSIAGMDDSRVAASLTADGLLARIAISADEQYWIEPLAGRIENMPAGMHVLYSNDAVIPSGGECGTTAAGEVHDAEARLGGGACGDDLCLAQLACDTDVEYFQDWGTVQAVEDRINAVINTVNLQYERDVQIRHTITRILVRTMEPDPYSSTNPGTLLGQFQVTWLSNHQAIVRDVAHLFTGKNLDGSVIGIAMGLNVICTDNAFCLSQSDCCGAFACATDLTAHELGHLWGGNHCNCANPAWTMNPSITCANRFNPATTIGPISLHRDSRDCLTGGSIGPFNDDCIDTFVLFADGPRVLDTINATTDGPALPDECGGDGDLQIGKDVWYCYFAQCSGMATASTCDDADFDTRIAVYDHCGCPTTNERFMTCSDDAAGCGERSEVQFPVTAGQLYTIRVGGAQPNGGGEPESGTGTLMVSCDAGVGPDVHILDAASVRVHGAGGPDETEMAIDLAAASGIEPRNGVAKLTFEMSETMQPGTVYGGNVQVDCANAETVPAISASLVNGQTVEVTFDGLLTGPDCCTFSFTGMLSEAAAPVVDTYNVIVLPGDMDFSGAVTGGDASLVKPHFGESLGTGDLVDPWWDFDTNGGVTGGDFSLIKPRFGDIAPVCP